jgi:pilus assembly protein CpaB
MFLRIALFLLIGLGSAGFAIVGWLGLHNASPAAEAAAAPRNRMVLVAARQLNAGSLLKPDDLMGAEVTDDDPKPGAWSDTQVGRSELVGAMIRRSLAPREVVMPTDVMRPGDHGFLAAVLGAGERAISVGVDAVSGNSGLIWPGDHVDLILTQALDASFAPPGRRIAGETVLHNVRVIAIDQDLVRGGGNSAKENSNNRTVTLEVSPIEAERVSVAVRLGKLSLVVVSADQINENNPSAPVAVSDSITWGGDVSHALRQGGNDRGTIRVFQGPSDSKEFHF